MDGMKKLREELEEELEIDVHLVTSPSYAFLFEVNKKRGDQAFRKSDRKFKYVQTKKGKISFTLNQLSNLAADYEELMGKYKKE